MMFTCNRDVASAGSTREEINTWLRNQDVHPDMIARVELAWYEIVVNIIDHDPGSVNTHVTSEIRADQEQVAVTITSTGCSFNPMDAPLPDPARHVASGKNRGLGIYMVRTLSDDMNYSQESGKNITSLYFNRRLPNETAG